MTLILFLLAPLAAADTDMPQRVVAALNEPYCPGLFALYADNMRSANPKEKVAELCNSVREAKGRLSRVEPLGREGSWWLYDLYAEHGRWRLKLAWDKDNRVTGLSITEPPPPPLRETRTRLRWPLTEETLVFWGGERKDVNAHADVPQQRRALDLDMADADGATHRGDGRHNEDYFIYGKPVVAAAAGTVIVAVDGVPDNSPGDMNAHLAAGNVVIIDQGNDEFAWYAHLKPGSLRVRPGQRINTGDVLGLVGNSGNSSEPHLHFNIQDSALMTRGFGIEPVFSDVVVVRNGKRDMSTAYRPLKGDRVTAGTK